MPLRELHPSQKSWRKDARVAEDKTRVVGRNKFQVSLQFTIRNNHREPLKIRKTKTVQISISNGERGTRCKVGKPTKSQ